MPEDNIDQIDFDELNKKALSKPLVNHIYTADPSAHLFNNKIYIYPSHDIDAGEAFDDLGSHFAMEDYHVFSMDNIGSKVVDHGIALHVDQVPWAEKQMWAPDANEKEGTFYLFFPAKDYDGIFRIGVATSSSPTGPFIPQPNAIKNSFSIDPAVFKDDDGSYYMYFGGFGGGNYNAGEKVNSMRSNPKVPLLFFQKTRKLHYFLLLQNYVLIFWNLMKNQKKSKLLMKTENCF